MCFGSSTDGRSYSEQPARPIELRPLSIQSSSSGRVRVPSSAHLSSSSSGGVRIQRGYASSSSSGGVRLPSSYAPSSSSGGVRLPLTSQSSSSSSVYIRDPVDWNTRPDVLARHRQYKAADVRHSADKGRYEIERRQRTVDRSQRSLTYTPQDLTLESHEYLGPVAGQWHGSANRHADLREGFLTDYPRAYRNKASVRTHREAAEAARNSAATAEGYMEEHTRYG
ncbi:hypothetical protein HO173_005270 [Letharia columbiana]|uniref:Uncharacterized protein n=1 Tax=Letharia columbiana TaxID=112416 RepID=A0A8H6FX72_9LECA|nr:uncharacterized protein HO173_005270 [Letharia columbiana]KAF6236489.1 hypothetical protein HO173_005270 [Letharia columbiana]